jgi:competence protein ComEA
MVMDFVKKNIYVIAGIACVILLGSLYLTQWRKPVLLVTPQNSVVIYNAEETPAPPPEAMPAAAHVIMVYITGEVVNPGVYEVNEGDRIADAVALAGGATASADLTRINLAARLSDAMQITVPAAGDSTADMELIITPAASASSVQSGLININTATKAELETLPGIGPAIAQYILDYRAENGPFTVIEDIMKVSRIGEMTFNRIRSQITV